VPVTDPGDLPQEWTTAEAIPTVFGRFPVYWGRCRSLLAKVRTLDDRGVHQITCTPLCSAASLLPSGSIRGVPITNATRYLNMTGKRDSFRVAHDNAIVQMLKENLQGYFPPPAVGLVIPPYTAFILTWTYHRTRPEPARHCPCTGRCGLHSAVSCEVGTCRRTIVGG